MEPSDQAFDETHVLFDSTGSILSPLLSASFVTTTASPDHNDTNNIPQGASTSEQVGTSSSVRDSQLVHSVLLAEGIHHGIDDTIVHTLPPRYEKGSSKAKLTWFGKICLAGIGMFVEAFIIITTGQIKTLWHSQYPDCWTVDTAQLCPNNIPCCGLYPNNPHDGDNGTCNLDTIDQSFCNSDGSFPDYVLCNESIIHSISYSEFAGIMVGMLVFGAITDAMGRTTAGILTSLFMIVGVTMMTFFQSPRVNTLFLVFSIFFGVFGLGVGGEYPLTATNAAAHHAESLEEALLDDTERRQRRILRDHERTIRRGETISLVFAMQGVGAVFGSLVLVFLIYFSEQYRVDCDPVFGGANSAGNDPSSLDAIWRSFYLIGMIFVTMLLLYRSLILEEGTGHAKLLQRKERRKTKLGSSASQNLFRILWFYFPRLIGTSGCWFVWDIAFYGLKLFSGPIFQNINPGGDLIVNNGYLLVNNLCALAGYYFAAYFIDWPRIGRLRLQTISFAMCAILFMATAAIFNSASPQILMTLFFLSSFFGNFGANVTTYVMAAETYPTELRGTCHGLSAFCGKSGALLATIVFSHVSTATIFWICGGVSVAGLFFTLVFSADLTHVSLAEHDAQLELFLEGTPQAYKGKLNDRKHLSNFEIWTGQHGEYDPAWAGKIIADARERHASSHPVTAEEKAI